MPKENINILGMEVATISYEHVVDITGEHEEQAFIDFVNADNEVILLIKITDTGKVTISVSENYFVEDNRYNPENVVLFQSREKIKFPTEGHVSAQIIDDLPL